MAGRSYLGEFEQMVLLSILQLGLEASGPGIGSLLEERVGREVSRGALYACLDRMERKGWLRWEIEAASSEQSGSRRRRFQVTDDGVEELRRSREALLELWTGLDRVLSRRST